jgi:antitoxin (DNA-binding transcriptional repressor) of toxin-antitoxin stability system
MSDRSIGVREFRENMSMYIAQAQSGKPVTIMSHGKPVAELHAPTERAVRPAPKFGILKGKITFHEGWDNWTEEELAAFEKPL